MDYQLFVDESGNREYDKNGDYRRAGKSKYFAYAAVLVAQDYAASCLLPGLQGLKKRIFGDRPEIKSNWLRIRHERAKRYLVPYGLTAEALTAFTTDYYDTLAGADVTLFGSIVNKAEMQDVYGQYAWYPPTAAYEFLLQRVVQAVPSGSRLSVIVDDIGGKTPKGNDYASLLSRHHRQLARHGSSLQQQISFACLNPRVRLVDSAKYELVQAADLVAYNVHRQFRDYGAEWEDPAARTLPVYPYLHRLLPKFRNKAGRIQGYGICKAPTNRRIRGWPRRRDEGGEFGKCAVPDDNRRFGRLPRPRTSGAGC